MEINGEPRRVMTTANTPSHKSVFQTKAVLIGGLGLIALAFRVGVPMRHSRPPLPTAPAIAAPASFLNSFDAEKADKAYQMRFLAARVRRDPEDFVACNMLAGAYLQQVRETGSLDYLERAARLAHDSLASVPDVKNTNGLATLTQAEFAAHEFALARDHARRLTQLDVGRSEPWGMLGDALAELGEYESAERAFKTMARMEDGIGVQTRLARLAALHGDLTAASRHYFNAVALAKSFATPPRETIAWCQWQQGETAFARGDYPAAEQDYRNSLTTYPNYYRALASLGRVRAARGDLQEGIRYYEQSVNVIPDPTFVAALGDLYHLAGREPEARAQGALVEQIAHLSKFNGALYNRQVTLFYADHDLKSQEAYQSAAREYAVRRDIYGADALAWSALKAGKLDIARRAIRAALRLGAQDARLFYHAGMIARAAGEPDAADYLRRALALNPRFDPLQAQIAAQTLASLTPKSAGEGKSAFLKTKLER